MFRTLWALGLHAAASGLRPNKSRPRWPPIPGQEPSFVGFVLAGRWRPGPAITAPLPARSAGCEQGT